MNEAFQFSLVTPAAMIGYFAFLDRRHLKEWQRNFLPLFGWQFAVGVAAMIVGFFLPDITQRLGTTAMILVIVPAIFYSVKAKHPRGGLIMLTTWVAILAAESTNAILRLSAEAFKSIGSHGPEDSLLIIPVLAFGLASTPILHREAKKREVENAKRQQ